MTATLAGFDTYATHVLGTREGLVCVAIGRDGKTNPKGTYEFAEWSEHAYIWPAERDQMERELAQEVASGERVDIYVAPAVRLPGVKKPRQKGMAAPPMVCWADLDGPTADRVLLDSLGALIVESGSDGHSHVYVTLASPVDLGTWRLIQVALRDRLGGDDKISDNDVLRLPGTLNYKTNPAGEVRVVSGPHMGWNPAALMELLGIHHASTGSSALNAGEPVAVAAEQLSADELSPFLLRQFTELAAPTDRSEAFHRLVAACRDAGLTLGKATTLMLTWRPGLEKYGNRVPAETARCWEKLPPPFLDGVSGGTMPAKLAKQMAFSDAGMAETVAADVLAGRFCWAMGLGWLRWDGKRWVECADGELTEQVRLYVLKRFRREALAGDLDEAKRWVPQLTAGKITSVLKLAQGIVHKPAAGFDQRPDLLNCSNGVVDLITGELLPHEPELLMTKLAPVEFDPIAEHPDWKTAMEAVPEDVRDWYQLRIGQGATGHMTPDDVLVVQQGGGANGKSTIGEAIASALGDYFVLVSDRVLTGSPDQHPTELMDLRGARFALVEETPEAGRLSVGRLKKVVGTPRMEARRIRQDPVKWSSTHSLFLSTNYLLSVEETDHGTWRRLALVRFPFTFRPAGVKLVGEFDRPGDETLRSRVKSDPAVHRAVLAWLVAGAVRWYAAGRLMPPAPARVEEDTVAWRAEYDLVLSYMADRVIVEPGRYVRTTDLRSDFNAWLTARGQHEWSERTFSGRFGQHDAIAGRGVVKKTVRPKPSDGLSERWGASKGMPSLDAVKAWVGLRFRERDEVDGARHLRPVPEPAADATETMF